MSTAEQKLPLAYAQKLAYKLQKLLAIYSERIHIAGSIRREKQEVGDIEIVALPIMIQSGFFPEDTSIDPDFFQQLSFAKLEKGKTENKEARQFKYMIPTGLTNLPTISLDLFIPKKHDYYRQLAIRTGPSQYSHHILATRWVKLGWVGTHDGLRRVEECEGKKSGEKTIWKCVVKNPTLPPVWESEEEFFEFLGLKYLQPQNRI